MASSPLSVADDIQPANDTAMSEDELASLLGQFQAQAVGEEWGEIASQQERALEYYYHRMPDLPAQEGSSGVVADTVQVTIDDAMAEVLKPFVSAEDFATFEPVGPEDEQQAEQATAYVNYVLHCDNAGFIIFHNWFKDALLTKLGIVKVWWKPSNSVKQQRVDAMGLLGLREHQDYAGEIDHGDGTYSVGMNEADGRTVIDCIPPEEFKISPFARSIEEAAYSAHAPSNVTRSDLVEMGYDRDTVYALPAWAGSGTEEGRRNTRYRDENYGGTNRSLGTPHASQEVVAFREEYIRIDFDGDGVAELRKVHRVEDVILLNEAVEDNPFAILCPKPMPHKVYGLSLADDTLELQKIDTVLWRQTLDNLYKSNNPRPVIAEAAERGDGSTLDSLADTAPGAAVYVKIAEMLKYEAVPFTADKSFPMMQLIEQKRAQRTGFSANGNGLDPEAISTSKQMTATQAAQIEDKANGRAEMIARIFAETGVKRLMRLVLRTLVTYQPRERMIRLRNQWVPMDPRGWSPDMDLTVQVGLGMGNRRENIAQAQAGLQVMAEAAMNQTSASLITPENAYNMLKKFFGAIGIKNVDDYVTQPDKDNPPQPPPDPAMIKAQADAEAQKAQLQLATEKASAELQHKQAESGAKLQMQQQEAALKLQLARDEAEQQASLAQAKARAEFDLAVQQQDFEMQLAERQQAHAETMATRKAEADEAISKNRPGGDLSK